MADRGWKTPFPLHEYSLTLQPGTGVYIWKYLHTDICLGNTEGALLESIK